MRNWELSKREYLSKKYSYMLERVTNPNKIAQGRNNLGLPICDREEFVEFGLQNENFHKFWRSYKRSKGSRKKAPAVRRVATKGGFVVPNLVFTTVSEYSGYRVPEGSIVLQNETTGKVRVFANTRRAATFLGHRHVIKVTRPAFVSLKTSQRYVNLTEVE